MTVPPVPPPAPMLPPTHFTAPSSIVTAVSVDFFHFNCVQGDRLEEDWVPEHDERPAEELEKEAAAAEAKNRWVGVGAG